MRLHGNLASNRHYNPKNKKPDIPLDADEVDSAMERFIRKKYQEKSLVDGRPEPPSRTDVPPGMTQTYQPPPSVELPPSAKKHKFFGFSLRTSSKKDRPGAQDAFKITPVEYSPTLGTTREISEDELQEKLTQLLDMGFSDNERNLAMLKRCGGNLERTIATLVKLGPSEPSRRQSTSPIPGIQAAAAASSSSAPPTASLSNNPFEQIRREQAQGSEFGLSFDKSQPQQPLSGQPSGNPWQSAIPSRQNTGLEQQFSGMQITNPLFPHNTGGYGTQTSYQHDARLQSMTPPVPQIPQQFGYTSSPTAASNPFHQAPVSSQSTGNNPFLPQQQSQPVFAPQTNPFMNMQQPQVQAVDSNPFGSPPTQAVPLQQPMASPQAQSSNPFNFSPSQLSPYTQQGQLTQAFPSLTHPAPLHFGGLQPPQPQIPNFNQGQAQQAQQQPLQQSQYLSTPSLQQHPSSEVQGFQQVQSPPQPQPQPQVQQPAAQQTGRYTKADIMALFNQPVQQPQLASIHEDPYTQQPLQSSNQMHQAQAQPAPQSVPQSVPQPVAPGPSNKPYGALSSTSPTLAKRSVTLPAAMHSSTNASHPTNTKNPFLSSATTSRSPSGTSVSSTPIQPAGQWPGQLQAPAPAPAPAPSGYGPSTGGWNQGARHASNESMSVNNPALWDGRHSPDAFAGLSAHY